MDEDMALVFDRFTVRGDAVDFTYQCCRGKAWRTVVEDYRLTVAYSKGTAPAAWRGTLSCLLLVASCLGRAEGCRGRQAVNVPQGGVNTTRRRKKNDFQLITTTPKQNRMKTIGKLQENNMKTRPRKRNDPQLIKTTPKQNDMEIKGK